MEIQELFEKYEKLEARVAQLEFREELLRYETNINGVLLDYNITHEQYIKIMDIMDEMRNCIDSNIEVSNADFENKIINIFGGDIEAARRDIPIEYHFCESVARSFMEDGRWEEVFPALYGDMQKYQYLKDKKNND